MPKRGANPQKRFIIQSVSVILAIIVLALFLQITGLIIFTPATVEPSKVVVNVPDIAVQKSPVLSHYREVQKIIFIHTKKEYAAKPSKAASTQCYGLLNAKWKSLPVNYILHPDIKSVVPNAAFLSAEVWDAATSKELFNNAYSIDASANWDDAIEKVDGKNELSFGDYPKSGVIAVTVIWTGVPISGKIRQIIDFDIMFDTDFAWGDASLNNAVMDLQNIATHELGHGVGLDDTYNNKCSEVTMYGYSSYGEIKKRALEQPDIIGLQKIYGA